MGKEFIEIKQNPSCFKKRKRDKRRDSNPKARKGGDM
jgi:hypothetical protein